MRRSLTENGGFRSARIRSAARQASEMSSVASSRTANSSPPKRAAVSPERSEPMQAPGHRHQELVAHGVAQAVVDELEVVEVQEQHGQRRQRPRRPGQGVLEAVPEQGPVGQPAQGVVEGLVLQLLLQALALGHVAQGEHDALDGRFAEQVVGDHLHVAATTRQPWRMRHSAVTDVPARKATPAVGGNGPFHVLGVEQRSEPPALQRPRFVAEDALRRGRLVGDGRVGPGDQDDVGGALYERLEPHLAPPGVEGLGQLLPVEGQADLGGQGLQGVGEVDGQLVGGSRPR